MPVDPLRGDDIHLGCFFFVPLEQIVGFPYRREQDDSAVQHLGHLLIHTPMELELPEVNIGHCNDSSKEFDTDADADYHERFVAAHR